MYMIMGSKALVFLVHNLCWSLFFSGFNACCGAESNFQCLKALKDHLNDPHNHLSSWIFSDDETKGLICSFNGIECWGSDEIWIRKIQLTNIGLQGHFPSALKNCKRLTGLDLSRNNLSGPIPQDIDELIPFVSVLDLSSNGFSCEIPPNLANCRYMNVVNLTDNKLTGQIPWELGRLNGLHNFTVANNSLSGQIPYFLNSSPPQNFVNNLGLCGIPLVPCKGPPRKSLTLVIIGSAAGRLVFAALIIAVLVYCLFGVSENEAEDVQGSGWVNAMKETKGFKISMFEKSVPRMRLFNLINATNNFSKNNIIDSGRTGTTYKAILSDSSLLAVKRLQESHHSDKHFISEITALASIRHYNLVPLLGFCVARRERLLIYKYMPRGTLHDQLHHAKSKTEVMDWAKRLRIGIGVARGLMWLHHQCNPCIIHHNISSKCILLDEEYDPKISNFGFARLMNPEHSHLSISLDGNFDGSAYIAPEYTRTLVATPKGDVYSFGMVMLELVSGKTPAQVSKAVKNVEDNITKWVTYLLNLYANDNSLNGSWCEGEIIRFLNVAFACVVSAPENRPTMLEVYQVLSRIRARYGFIGEEEES